MTGHGPDYPSRAVAWYAAIVLAILSMLSVMDRFIISLMVDPIKRDLGITDVQFGLLHGTYFSIAYALFGLVLGFLADRYARRCVIFVGVAFWSLATAVCGMVQNYAQLALARIGVGVGEATLGPNATSLLADLFPRERLTAAVALWTVGSSIGAGLAYFIGGQVVGFVSSSPEFVLPLVGAVRSWQVVFFVIGLPGVLMAFLVFTFREPLRRGLRSTTPDAQSFLAKHAEMGRFFRSRARFFVFHYLGFMLAAVVVVGNGGWYAAHLGRNFHWAAGDIGLAIGVMTSVSSIVGMTFAGRIADWMFRRGHKDAQLRWYVVCLLIATPLTIIAMTSGNAWVYLVFAGLALFFTCGMPVCAMTSVNLVTPNELRGTGIAWYSTVSGVTGAAFGSAIIAAVAQYVYQDEKAIGLAMATVAAVCLPLSALCLWRARAPMRAAAAEAESWTNTGQLAH